MNRSSFLATTTAVLASVPGGTHLVERRANFDEAAFARAVGRTARIRQMWEAVAFHPGIWNNVKNALNGLQFGFGYEAGAIAMVMAGHGPSAAYGYGDAVWSKYRLGEAFKLTDGGRPVTSNVYLRAKAPDDRSVSPDDVHGFYQDVSIETLQKRGLVMLTCHTAVEEQSRALVARGFAPGGMSAQDVADDILTHLIPGAIVVPSMVATVAVLQAQYHYTYISPAF